MGVKMVGKLPLALALASGLGSAHAAFVDLGVHPFPFVFQAADVAVGDFADFYTFTVPVGFELLGSVVVAGDAPEQSIAGGTYLVVGAGTDNILGNADDVMFSPAAGFSFDVNSGGTFNAMAGAGAGLYAYAVLGTADGALGGQYALTSFVGEAVVAVVPEPETYALLLAGLGAVGAVARRRRTGTSR